MKDKQIEEMAQIIAAADDICLAKTISMALYDAGYRKQEWISVEDRLPEEFISVLGYMTDAGDFPPVRECYKVGGVFFFPALGDRHPISHWMPLPEPPKGEENDLVT